ncbi:MAG: type II toxin-antitoxin system PemK/MazF family toxin [Deltaproteobacteria bacterium]|nr:type II toxin-antitoxin system PemK/MazF family toxin [Deltaproteobacteria bacterium]
MNAGDIVLVPFPTAEAKEGKHRPVLILACVPSPFHDYVACMISSRIHQAIDKFDLVVRPEDAGFAETGLKVASLVRLGRLATLNESIFAGVLGRVSDTVLASAHRHLRELFSFN